MEDRFFAFIKNVLLYGFVAIGICACGISKKLYSNQEVIRQILNNECRNPNLEEAQILVRIIDPIRNFDIKYPDSARCDLTDSTYFQIGGLTRSFYAANFIDLLHENGMRLKDTAWVFKNENESQVISYEDLFLHRSNIPTYEPDVRNIREYLELYLAKANELANSEPRKYRFKYWNYALANLALSKALNKELNLRADLSYADQLKKGVRESLAPLNERKTASSNAFLSKLFAGITGGISNLNELEDLLETFKEKGHDKLIEADTNKDTKHIKVVPGWHKKYLKNGSAIFVSSGHTRNHGAGIAYYPTTETAVIVLTSKNEDPLCLALDLLRNVNKNWNRKA